MIRQPDSPADAGTLALNALVWTLGDPDRAGRLLAVTGIDPDDLRARLDDPAVLGASLHYLLAHEADLLACADALEVKPAALARAAEELDR
jgi:hypothetical protein